MSKVSFISIEGIDGSGKTTIASLLVSKLNEYYQKENKFILTREPGGSFVGEQIRKIILDNDMDPYTEALLFASSRTHHVKNIICPAIENNQIVISDRFLTSSLVYQGKLKGIDVKKIEMINDFGINHIRPQIIFWIEIDSKTSIERLKNRNNSDRLDHYDEEVIKKVISYYEEVLDDTNNSKIIKINGKQEISKITDEIFNIILKYVD